MNRSMFKKIALGSILISTTSAILFTSVSSYNVKKQSNNTSAYESIYKQKTPHNNRVDALSTSSTAFMSKTAGAENSITSNYQNVNPATTQVLQTPQNFAQSHTDPTTTTSTDGKNVHTFKGFHGENATFTSTNGTPGAWDPATESVTVTGIKQGVMQALKIFPKPGFTWPKAGQGVMTRPWTPVQTYVGITKPKVTSSGLDPSLATSHDGIAEFTLSIWDPNTMNISLVPGSAGTLGNQKRLSTSHKVIVVTGLAFGEQAKLQVSLKSSGERWTDGTTAAVQSIFTPRRRSPLPKPTFTHTVKSPTMPTSSDGEVTFTLTHFIPEMMKISLSHGSSGTLGTYDPQTKQIKVTGLKVAQYAQISISPKTSSKGIKVGPEVPGDGMGIDDDKTSKTNMFSHGAGTTKTVTVLVSEINEVDILFEMRSLKTSTANPDFFAIQNNPTPFAKNIHTSFDFDYNKNKWTFRGKEVETKAHAATWTLDSETSSGNPSKSEVKMWVESFNKATNQVVIKYTIKLLVNGWGEDNAGIFLPRFTAKHINALWSDDTANPVKSSFVSVRLKKTTFTKTVIQPTTTTTSDGEVIYTLTNFDPTKMNISLVAGSSGTLGSYDPFAKQVKVTGLSNGQHAQISVSLKNSVTISQNVKNFTLHSFGIEDDATSKPHMSDATNTGNITLLANENTEVEFNSVLKSWKSSDTNPTLSNILSQGTFSKPVNGTLTFDSASQKWTSNGASIETKANALTFVLDSQTSSGNASQSTLFVWVESFDKATKQLNIKTELKLTANGGGEDNAAFTNIIFALKTTEWTPTWSDGTTTPQQSTTFAPTQTYTGLTKTTFTKTVKQPTTTTTADGEVTYTLTNFDPNKMDISLVAGSSGTLGSYDPITKQVKVTGLSNGQHAQIFVSMKVVPANVQTPHETIVKRGTIKSFGIEDDNNNSNPSMFWKDIAGGNTRNITLVASENAEVEFNSVLKSWKSGDANPTLSNILNKGTFSKPVNGTLTFDSASQKWTSNGASVETKANALTFVLDSQTSSGNASQSTLFVWVESFNKITEQLNIKTEFKLTMNGYGEDNAAFTNIIFASKTKAKAIWTDGTIAHQKSSTFTPAQTYTGSIKPTFIKVIKQPTTTTTSDGEATYTLTNFDKTKMDIYLAPGSKGVLGKYNPVNQTIKVYGLKVGQHAQIQIILNKTGMWKDATRVKLNSSKFFPAQTRVGLKRVLIKKVVQLPKTTTSADGEITYTLTNFDPTKMSIVLAPGSHGILGSYNPQTKQIKVTGIIMGDKVQIKINLNSTEMWTDGSTKILFENLNQVNWFVLGTPLVAFFSTFSGIIILISLIFSQRYHFNFKYMQKIISLNFRLFKAVISIIFLKILSCFSRKK